ncbi:uncharacterized protein BJ212DRAFT_1282336, partial [Suillus subaureus]
ATSVDVKWLFSHGHLILLHTRSHLSVQSMHALLCLGLWSELGIPSVGHTPGPLCQYLLQNLYPLLGCGYICVYGYRFDL